MRAQQAVWQKEHTDMATLPTMSNVEPTSGVAAFGTWLAEHGHTHMGKAIDIGCGKGRNSVYLASLGYEVWAVDYIHAALDRASSLAAERGVDDKIHFVEAEVDASWQFANDFFDVAVDSFSSIDIETKAGRETYRDEMYRTLKPGGLAIVLVCSANDEWERELIAAHPGPEPNSAIWPQNGKFQKNYDEQELRNFYDKFEIVELQTVTKPAYKLGRHGTSTILWTVLRKPKG